MKTIFRLIILSVSLMAFEADAQCPYDNAFFADLTPTVPGDVQTEVCAWAGDLYTVDVIVGETYVFSTCGSAAGDSELTLYTSGGGIVIDYNDDGCGLFSTITWVATFTGTVDVLVDEWDALFNNCQSGTSCFELVVTWVGPCPAYAGTTTVTMSNPAANNYVLCQGDDITIDENLDAVLPSSPDIAGLGYAIYNCPPTTNDPDTDPCWTGYYWTGGNFTDFNGPGNIYEFLSTNPIGGYPTVSGNSICLVPITMDDIATIAGGGFDDNLGHDLDLDGCFDLGTPICIEYLPAITFNTVESCSPNTATVTISGGYPDINGGATYTVTNTGPGTIVQSGTQGETITITGYISGQTLTFNVTNDDNSCNETFSFVGACAACSADAGTTTVTMSNPTANNYALCQGDNITIDENLDAVLPSSPDVAGLGYAIYNCPPTTNDPDTDPCWTGYYWTGGNFTDFNGPGSIYEFLSTNPIGGYSATSGNSICLVPITMDDIATIADGGIDDNLGHDLDLDGCFDLGSPICIEYLPAITFNTIETCSPNTVTVTISGGYPGVNGGATYTVTNTGSGTFVQSGTQGETITITGYTNGQTLSFDVTNDGNTCSETFSFVGTCAGCLADVGTFTITNNGIPVGNPIFLCATGTGECIDIVSNDDYVLPPPVPGEESELMYAIYTCLPTGGIAPDLDPCYTGLLWTGEDFNDCNNAGSILLGAGLGPTVYYVPITMDDSDNAGDPNGLIHWDNDGDGCYATGTPIQITYLDDIVATVNSTDPCSGVTTISITGGMPVYDGSNYTITNTGPGTITGGPISDGGVITVSGLSNGQVITLNISDSEGCVESFSSGAVSVTAFPSPIIAPDPAEVCAGLTLTLNGTPTGGSGTYTTHAWTNTGASSLTATNVVNPDFSNATPGFYDLTYTVTDDNGCVGTDDITVTVNANPTSVIAPDPAEICAGLVLSLDGTPAGGSGSYTTHVWTNAGSTSLTATNIVNPDFSNATAGPYDLTYTVTDDNGCVGTDNITVTVNANPTSVIAPDPAEVCAGLALSLDGAPAGGSGTYTTHVWTNTGSTSLTATNVVNPDFSNATAGPYDLTYTVTDDNGCIGTDNITVTVNANPTSVIAPDPAEVCAGLVLTLDGTPNGGSGTYTTHAWTNTGATSLTATNVVNPDFSNATAGPYDLTYTVTDDNGCIGSDDITVTVNANPVIGLVSNNPTTCDLTDGEIEVSLISGPTSNGTINWTGTETGNSGATTLTDDITNLPPGNYNVSFTDGNGCVSSAEPAVLINPAAPIIDAITDTISCGVDYQLILADITGTDLTANLAFYDATDGPNGIGSVITDGTILTSGTTTVYVYDGIGTCTDEQTITITINPLPVISNMTGGNDYCIGDPVSDITIDVTGTANWTIDYTLDGVGQNVIGSSSPISLGSAEGVYVVTNITDANCTSATNGTQTITINQAPNAPLAGTDAEYCSSIPVTDIVASGTGGTYTWYSNSNLTSILGSGATYTPSGEVGTSYYYVTETVNGCEGPESEVVITIIHCDITIPTAITPDGDGVNDDWDIVDIDNVYPNNIVYVYNRWGALLFTSEQGNYDANRWDATFKGSGLPVGSYYFIIDFNNEEKESTTGIVSIILNK